jgi:hypothetical protein
MSQKVGGDLLTRMVFLILEDLLIALARIKIKNVPPLAVVDVGVSRVVPLKIKPMLLKNPV